VKSVKRVTVVVEWSDPDLGTTTGTVEEGCEIEDIVNVFHYAYRLIQEQEKKA
jgi:hypothetical protein